MGGGEGEKRRRERGKQERDGIRIYMRLFPSAFLSLALG